jgi:membrane protein
MAGSRRSRTLTRDAPRPQPEHDEPRLEDPGPRQLSRRDYAAAFQRAARGAVAHHLTDVAAAVTYYTFSAIPAALLIAVGTFGLVADPSSIATLLDRVRGIVPAEAVELLDDALRRTVEAGGRNLWLVVGGAVAALWTATSGMNALMRGLNRAYDRGETRPFVRIRAVALALLALAFVAFVLVFVLLVLGPYVSGWVGEVLGLERVFSWLWWTAQWPILVGALLAVFATILYLGPDVEHPRWVFITFGAAVAVAVWLLTSGAFAFYAGHFGSYNATWGPLSAVVVMLTWLWLSTLALLFGAEVNAEVERSRELRRGEPAEHEIQAPTKG